LGMLTTLVQRYKIEPHPKFAGESFGQLKERYSEATGRLTLTWVAVEFPDPVNRFLTRFPSAGRYAPPLFSRSERSVGRVEPAGARVVWGVLVLDFVRTLSQLVDDPPVRGGRLSVVKYQIIERGRRTPRLMRRSKKRKAPRRVQVRLLVEDNETEAA